MRPGIPAPTLPSFMSIGTTVIELREFMEKKEEQQHGQNAWKNIFGSRVRIVVNIYYIHIFVFLSVL